MSSVNETKENVTKDPIADGKGTQANDTNSTKQSWWGTACDWGAKVGDTLASPPVGLAIMSAAVPGAYMLGYDHTLLSDWRPSEMDTFKAAAMLATGALATYTTRAEYKHRQEDRKWDTEVKKSGEEQGTLTGVSGPSTKAQEDKATDTLVTNRETTWGESAYDLAASTLSTAFGNPFVAAPLYTTAMCAAGLLDWVDGLSMTPGQEQAFMAASVAGTALIIGNMAHNQYKSRKAERLQKESETAKEPEVK